MYTVRHALVRNARLKVRAAQGSSLQRRRSLATEVPSATIFGSSPSVPTSPVKTAAEPDPPHASTSKLPFQQPLSTSLSRHSSVPPPIHPSFRPGPLTQHNIYPASATLEQLSLLEVCLATGDLTRARRIFDHLRNLYDAEARHYDQDNDDFDPVLGKWQRRLTLPDLLPAHIHTQYLRAILRQAIVVDQAKTDRGGKYKKRVLVSEAWARFEMLLNDEALYGRLEDAAWAVMFKGLVA